MSYLDDFPEPKIATDEDFDSFIAKADDDEGW